MSGTATRTGGENEATARAGDKARPQQPQEKPTNTPQKNGKGTPTSAPAAPAPHDDAHTPVSHPAHPSTGMAGHKRFAPLPAHADSAPPANTPLDPFSRSMDLQQRQSQPQQHHSPEPKPPLAPTSGTAPARAAPTHVFTSDHGGTTSHYDDSGSPYAITHFRSSKHRSASARSATDSNFSYGRNTDESGELYEDSCCEEVARSRQGSFLTRDPAGDPDDVFRTNSPFSNYTDALRMYPSPSQPHLKDEDGHGGEDTTNGDTPEHGGPAGSSGAEKKKVKPVPFAPAKYMVSPWSKSVVETAKRLITEFPPSPFDVSSAESGIQLKLQFTIQCVVLTDPTKGDNFLVYAEWHQDSDLLIHTDQHNPCQCWIRTRNTPNTARAVSVIADSPYDLNVIILLFRFFQGMAIKPLAVAALGKEVYKNWKHKKYVGKASSRYWACVRQSAGNQTKDASYVYLAKHVCKDRKQVDALIALFSILGRDS